MAQKEAIITRNKPKEDVVLLQLSEHNKEILLKAATQKVEESHDSAVRICRGLRQLSQETANHFDFKSTAISEAPLRLLFSRDASVVLDISKHVSSYIIISYTWRDKKSWEPKGNKADPPKPWPFQQMLIDSVMELRSSADEGIWFDGRCINQKDEAEKQVAIGVMDVLYKSARVVVICLEDVQLSGAEQDVVGKYWNKIVAGESAFMGWTPPEAEVCSMVEVFCTLVSSRWFSRAWCSHEFRVGKFWGDPIGPSHPRFRVLGSRGKAVRVPAILLTAFLSVAQRYQVSCSTNDSRYTMEELIQRFSLYFTPSPVQTSQDPYLRIQESLVAQYNIVSNLGISVVNDRVQIAINVCGIPIFWKGLADTEDEARWIFNLIALAAGEAAVLSFVGARLKFLGSGPKFPFSTAILESLEYYSWMRHPHNPLYQYRLPLNQENLGISLLSRRYLDIDLLVLENKPRAPTAIALHLADKVLPAIYQSYDALGGFSKVHSILEASKQRQEPDSGHSKADDWPSMTRLAVACAVDCGVEWMKTASGILNEAVGSKSNMQSLNWMALENDESIAAAASAILSFHGVRDDSSIFQEHFDSILKLLAIITNPHFTSFGLGVIGHILVNIHGDRALLNKFPAKYTLAVPKVLASQDWITTRLFVLESYYINGKRSGWRIVFKHYLLGCQTLVADGRFITLRERQRIYGGAFHDEPDAGYMCLDAETSPVR